MASNFFWVLMLIVLLSCSILFSIIIFFYYRITNKLKNDLVARIHMLDYTVKTYRYHEIPANNIIAIEEIDNHGKTLFKIYNVRENCIEKGRWGRYIEYDYNNSEPIDPHARGYEAFIKKFLEMFKLIGAFLDTDLHVRLMRNSEFENFVRVMLLIILILCGIGAVSSVAGTIKVFTTKQSSDCILKLDNTTWNTLYIASHVPPPQIQATQGGNK
jgi:hypothetical protein